MQRPSPRTNLPSNSLSQRTSLRLSTLHAEVLRTDLFRSENNSPMANSFREKLPKFRTQESSLGGKKKGVAPKLHFPELIVRESNPSQYTLHSLNVEEMKSKVAKTSYILDSIIKIFNDDSEPSTYPSREKKPQPLDDFNEFIQPGKERRAKRPKIIQNKMTRIFLSSKEKQRKTKPLIQQAFSQKLEVSSFRNKPSNPSRMANNEFLPEGKEQLNKLRTLRFSKH